MKKRFNSLWSAIIYFSLVVILFGLLIALFVIYKTSVICSISAGFLVGVYLNKIIRVVKVMRFENRILRNENKFLEMLGVPKAELKRMTKAYKKARTYVIK